MRSFLLIPLLPFCPHLIKHKIPLAIPYILFTHLCPLLPGPLLLPLPLHHSTSPIVVSWWVFPPLFSLLSLHAAFCPVLLFVPFFGHIQCPPEHVFFSLSLKAFCSLSSTWLPPPHSSSLHLTGVVFSYYSKCMFSVLSSITCLFDASSQEVLPFSFLSDAYLFF